MKKTRPKWFQPEAVFADGEQNDMQKNTNALEQSGGTAAADKTESSEDPANALKNIFLNDLRDFKQQGLYDEALACVQNIIEIQGVDSELLYEAAQLYFLKEDYRRSANCLKSFRNVHPKDGRGYLLQIKILLHTGKKETALNLMDNFFQRQIKLTGEEEYETLDKIIDKLKKIFKADKLLRRSPYLAQYQKRRRQMLKEKENADKTDSKADAQKQSAVKGDPALPTKAETNDDMNTDNENTLLAAIAHIWDMQRADAQDAATVAASCAEAVCRAIEKQVLSCRKKLWLYNRAADAYRRQNNLEAAVYMLRQALALDDEDDLILKNLGYLLYKKGELNAAQAVLEDIAQKDFSADDLIKLCKKNKVK